MAPSFCAILYIVGILCKSLLFPTATLIDIPINSFMGHNALKKHKTRVTISDSAVALTIAASPYVAAQSFTQYNGVLCKLQKPPT
jgi:hypothetical protein